MRLLWIVPWVLIVATSSNAASTSPAIVVLTSIENGLESQSEFMCYGKIHGYIRLASPQEGTHVLSSRWVQPSGKFAADSRSTVDFSPARSTAYVWFGFPESALFGAPDPGLDEMRLQFNGIWTLDVRWDEKPLLNETFHVRCP